MLDTTRSWIIEVTVVGNPEHLDASDCDLDGQCLVDGAYRLTIAGGLASGPDPESAALDVFHTVVPISCLEDFQIVIRPEGPEDAGEGWLRRDLGRFDAVPGPDLPDFLR